MKTTAIHIIASETTPASLSVWEGQELSVLTTAMLLNYMDCTGVGPQ